MTTAPYPQVTNELLSAYIDQAVSEEERRLIEQAVAEDPDVAWRLESLRATVRLLHELPALSLPRSFVLTAEQVGQAFGAVVGPAPDTVTNTALGKAPPRARRQAVEEQGRGFWHGLRRGWGRFWQGGSPAFRNAMAASFAVLLTLVLAPRFLANTSFVSLGSVETAASDVVLQNAAPAEAPATASAAEQVAKTGREAAKQSVPATVSGESGAAAPDTTTASVVAATAAQPTAVPPTAVAKASPNGQAENAQAGAVSGPSADAAAVHGGGAPGALAASAPPAAPPGPAQAAPTGRSVLDAASAQAGPRPQAPAASARISAGMAEGAAAAPVAPAAGFEVTAAYAATPQAGSFVTDAAAGPATGLLAEAGTQESLATAVATVAAEPAPAEATETNTGAAPAAVLELTPVDATTAAAATSAPLTEVVADSSSAAGEQAASKQAASEQAGPAPAAPAAQPGGLPAWLGLGLQTAALLAALSTLIFAILWWRSRSPQSRA